MGSLNNRRHIKCIYFFNVLKTPLSVGLVSGASFKLATKKAKAE